MKAVYATLCALLLIAPLSVAKQQLGAPVVRTRMPSYHLPEQNSDAAWEQARFVPPRPLQPRRDDVMGDQFQAGDTYYDLQTNSTVGRLIAFDNAGGTHVTWMDGFTTVNEGTRQQKYNFFEDGAFTQGEDGVVAPIGSRSGYGMIGLSNEDTQRAIIFCHALGLIEVLTAVTCVDFDRGFGAFETFMMPNYPENFVAWAQGVCTPEGKLHIVYNREGANYLSYTSADFNGGQPDYPDSPIQISEMSHNAYRISNSPVSERAAIIYPQARLGLPAGEGWDGTFPFAINNDLMLVTTEDGENWNFDNPYNITQCIPPNSELEGDEVYGDTLRPAWAFDLIFDQDDNIHVVFGAYGLWEKPDWAPSGDADDHPWAGFTRDAAMLFHWTEEDCTFSPVADGWFSQQIFSPENPDSIIFWPMPEAWRANVCNPSLGYDDNGDLYCVFNYFPYGDYNDYVGRDIPGRCHGDVSATVSTDNGRNWYHPTRIVETPTPFAQVGEAMSESYPTMAEKVDDNLHIFYILDLEGGSTIVNDAGASNTINPAIYLRTPKDWIARDSIYNGPNFHYTGDHQADVANEPVFTPAGFRLTGAYPNPFNSRSVIEFELDRTQGIELALYGLDGRQAKVLYSGPALSGLHQVTLDGDGLAAGLYLVRLSGSGSTTSMKVALVK